MRPGQQSRRGRNRNNNRKGPNPLSRNYESNGPDVKIRGNAQHIADKYAQLARDASAAGDRVMAENYLQHAEHYNRIIAAAMPVPAPNRDDMDDDDQDNDGDGVADAGSDDRMDRSQNGSADAPQPVIDGVPAEVAMEEEEVRSATSEGNGGKRRPRTRRRRDDDGNSDQSGDEAVAAKDKGSEGDDGDVDSLPAFLVAAGQG